MHGPTNRGVRCPPAALPAPAAFWAACVWAAPHLGAFYIVFAFAWHAYSKPGTAAIAAAVWFVVQAMVCSAASRPVLQLLTCSIALASAVVAHLAWGCAWQFSLIAALPTVLAGEMALRRNQRVDGALACMDAVGSAHPTS